MFKLKKRAVSPLIATVLLIAFAVSLGAVIMNLGVNLTSKCDLVQAEFLTVGDTTRVCYDEKDGVLRFTVNNKGEVQVDGYKIVAVGDSSDVEEFFTPIGAFEKDPRDMDISGRTVSDVTLIPYLEESNKIRICSEQVKEYTNIPSCK